MINFQVSQQIWIQILTMYSFAEVGARTESMYAHFPHITPGPFSIDMNVIILVQYTCHPAIAIFRIRRVNFINDTLNQVFLLIYRSRLVVNARTV